MSNSKMHIPRHITTMASLAGMLVFSSLGKLDAQDSQPLHHTQLSVLSFANTADHGKLRWLKTGDKLDEKATSRVFVSSSSILDPVKYSGPRTLTLCIPDSSGRSSEGDDKIAYTPLAKVTLPSSKKVIVLLLPRAKNSSSELPYRALAIDGSTPRFSNGSRYIMNFTKLPVRGVMGRTPFLPNSKKNKRFLVQGGKKTILPALDSSAPAREGRQAYVEYYDATSKQWIRITSARWFHSPNKRKFVFIYLHPGSSTPQLKIISENIPQPG